MTIAATDELRITHRDATRLEQATDQVRNVRQWVVGESEESTDDTMPGLAGRLIEKAGAYPGKYDPPIALSTHLINAIVTGLNAYVYDRVVCEGGDVDDEEVRLLIGALALHDANKYVKAAYDTDLSTDDNSAAVLEYYFDRGDDLGITQILPGDSKQERQLDIADIKWLVQRTETKDTRSSTRGRSTQRARSLERYCRIGDGFVSTVHSDGLEAGAEWLTKFFDNGGQHVHHLQFTELEQPILNDHLLASVKELIETGTVDLSNNDAGVEIPAHGIVMGSTPDSILYLGEPIDREALREAVEAVLMDRITDQHDFSPKTNWNAFEYDILEEIDIPFEEKHRLIAEGYAETLRRGSGTDHEFETVPEEFKQGLPELAKAVFRDQQYETVFEDYPALATVWETADEEYSVFSRKIGFLAEALRRWTGSVADRVDPEALQTELAAFIDEHRPRLQADLEPDSEAGPVVVNRFFESGLQTELSVPDGDEMCFLCGRPAAREFKKGNDAFYKTQSYSRRVEPEAPYKRICPVCNLEHALLRDTIEEHDLSVGSDIKIAFVYYDEFVGNLTVGAGEPGDRLVRSLLGEDTDNTDDSSVALRAPELVASSFEPQYHLQPFYADNENQRLREVRELLETLVTRGFKVVIGKPFTGFEPQSTLFTDLSPSRRQTAFGADHIDSYDALRRVRRLFTILRKVADESDYRGGRELLSIQRDGFRPIADLVARGESVTARETAHEHFCDSSYQDEYMQMRTVAQAGTDLYGYEYGSSRHKKTKVFREAVDATLDGLNRGLGEEELYEHVAGQIYKLAQEDSGYATTEQAEAFVDALFEYLRATGSFDKESLSQRRNTLANTYLFAYDQLLSEYHDDEDEESTEASA